MIRLYKETVRYLLACAAAFRAVSTTNSSTNLASAISNHWFRGVTAKRGELNEVNDQLLKFLDDDSLGNIDEVMKDVADVLNQQDQNYDRELIDQMIAILKSAYPSNVLAGKTMDKLMKAILLPEELTALRETVRKAEMHCVLCGRQVDNGELVTLVTRDGGAGLTCLECKPPSIMKCYHPDCTDNVPVPLKMIEMIGTARCAKHATAEPETSKRVLKKQTTVAALREAAENLRGLAPAPARGGTGGIDIRQVYRTRPPQYVVWDAHTEGPQVAPTPPTTTGDAFILGDENEAE